ncbi:site-specific integrase [Mucilaginibacter paludis]|uniref:Integrase family protein n=1 Tax=Mucilaginibacter paludis DSM 18603 TaxID=714943 RepID=H1Y3M2_9SPHI|nr:site-specific integrase [Mucilaginibacter paludis]EHQ29790.1 integrase family protein [Mucilaginibacter paludis DSM 18603]
MATIKFYLRKTLLADGTSPLVLKVLKDGKPSISHIGVNLLHEHWDAQKRKVKKSHPNATKLNNYLLKKLAEANNTAIDASTVDEQISSRTLMKKIKPKTGGSFFVQAEAFMNDLKATGNFNEYNANTPRIARFKEFLNGNDIAFNDITVALLERYKVWLRSTRTVGKEKRPIGERTVVNHIVIIRSVFSKAIENGATEKKYYPFGKNGLSIKIPKAAKIGLDAEDVQRIIDAEFTNPNHNHARNLWLISFYFGGMRASDIFRLKWSDFRENRLYYTMGKNNVAGTIEVDPHVFTILKQYEHDRRNAHDFIFPELKQIKNLNDEFLVEKIINDSVVRVDKWLRKNVAPTAKIVHRLTLHIARHTFGNLAGENIPLVMLQKIFRHSKITTTMEYMGNFINKETDKALATVLDKVKKKVASDT